jgi:putative SOS response-associated peptidase YedK
MCGRFILGIQGQLWPDLIELYPEGFTVVPRYNVAPTQSIPAVRSDGGSNRLEMMRWGLVPFWIKKMSDSSKYINARGETITERATYKNAFARRRCLIPATGFFEWRKGPGKTRQPMVIRLKTREPFAFAGIWERATPQNFPEEGEIVSCSIITTAPNDLVQPIHDRMPVILSPELYKDWLNPDNQDFGELKEFLLPYDPGLMEAYPVSNLVNSIKNDGAELIEPVALLPGES